MILLQRRLSHILEEVQPPRQFKKGKSEIGELAQQTKSYVFLQWPEKMIDINIKLIERAQKMLAIT